MRLLQILRLLVTQTRRLEPCRQRTQLLVRMIMAIGFVLQLFFLCIQIWLVTSVRGIGVEPIEASASRIIAS